MSSSQHDPKLDRLLELARAAQPAESSPTDARRLARRAVLAGIERGRVQRTRHVWVWSAAAAGVLAALILSVPVRHAAQDGLRALLGPSRTQPSAAPPSSTSWEPLELALPAGDRLYANPGAQFELLENTRARRRIALRDGTAVFSVEPLARGDQFSVLTPHARVQVRGTVFSIEVDGQRTRVRVHEGEVLVDSGGTARSLRAGQGFGSDAAPVPQLLSEPMSKRVAALVVERMQRKAERVRLEQDASIGPGHEPPEPAPVAAPRASGASEQAPADEEDAPAVAAARELTLEQARALLHAGALQQALAAARARDKPSGERGEWLLLEGDALRALNESSAAVHAYRAAHAALRGERRAHAAFKAADLLLRVLDDPRAALAMLDRARLDAPSAPLRERALLLRIEARQRLELPVRALATRYLADYPDSSGAERMRRLLGE